MQQVDALAAEAFAPALTITHQETGALEGLNLSAEQIKVMTAIEEHARVIVLKGRQVFISTCCVLYALLFARVNPGVKIALVADIKDKAEGLLAKATAWAFEASAAGLPGFKTKAPTNTKILTLANGAEIHAITANSKDTGSKEVKAGRSFSYGLIVLSEFAYYTRDAALLAALTRSALAGARIVIETTATPAENAFRAIWDKGRGWFRVFLPFEMHDAYQLPVDSVNEDGTPILDDATWAELQTKYEFTSRTHATYWWRMVQTDMNGDVHRGLREAPIKPEHAFAFAEGRWIFRYDEATPVRGADGWDHYDAIDESGCIIGVDTASGVGADASAIVVIGRDKGNLLASWRSDTTSIPDFITVVRTAVSKWKPLATVVESNGIGMATYYTIATFPLARAHRQISTEAEKPIRMNILKLAIESGQVVAGPDLQHEIKHSMMMKPRRTGGGAVWDGPDDLLNAIGFALVHRAAHPWRAPVAPRNARTHVDRGAYRKSKRKKGVF